MLTKLVNDINRTYDSLTNNVKTKECKNVSSICLIV